MKLLRSPRSNAAFTLIELLVVISIIAILASIAVPTMSGAMKSAKKVQAKNDITQLENAVNSYYTDYGSYPIPAADAKTPADVTYGTSIGRGNESIINVLRLPSTAADPDKLNPRGTRYLQIPNAKSGNPPTYGIITTKSAAANTGAWVDPWGIQYILFMDGDYDGAIKITQINTCFGTGLGTEDIQRSVGAASVGLSAKDANTMKLPKARYDKTTDLLSWQ